MRKALLSGFFILMGLFGALNLTWASDSKSPAGMWETIDDKTGKAQSIVRITQTSQGQFEGTIIKGLEKDKKNSSELCTKCEGDLKNKPIIGMRFMWGLEPAGELAWKNGKILDPRTGEIYDAKMELIDNGQKLKLRGFLGVSILGRTQIWNRVSDSYSAN